MPGMYEASAMINCQDIAVLLKLLKYLCYRRAHELLKCIAIIQCSDGIFPMEFCGVKAAATSGIR